MEKGYFYFLSNKTRSLLYAGAIVNLAERIKLHKKGKGAVFTKRYYVRYLVYFEVFDFVGDAFKREKQIKNWHKEWKWELIKKGNPNLLDLTDNFE